ncbi:hypothetical protein DSO57_1015348 [Entomophthora muscae]|uniref:Uncharacterized protein n=1 Tax=Entomophthora muscae TaxID=34485 RepID=A0ACC2UQQ3_9FUNG|nr:hypothetical protein DSO57_1015348 [Entomophthora muscae]
MGRLIERPLCIMRYVSGWRSNLSCNISPKYLSLLYLLIAGVVDSMTWPLGKWVGLGIAIYLMELGPAFYLVWPFVCERGAVPVTIFVRSGCALCGISIASSIIIFT